jgi:MFS family permease
VTGLPPRVLQIAAFNFTLFMAWQITLPVIPLIALSMRAGPVLLGVTVGASAVLPILLSLPAGRLTDRLAPRTLNLTAAGLMVAATALIGTASSIVPVIVGQALVGLSVTVASIAGQAFIAMTTRPGQRDGVFGRYAVIIAADTIIGPALGGFLAASGRFPMALGAALAFALLSVPQALWLSGRRNGATAAAAARMSSAALLRTPAVLMVLTAAFLIIFGHSLRQSFYVLYLDRVGFSSKLIGLLLSLGGVATIATRPLLGWITQRTGREPLLALIAISMGLALGLVPLARGVFLTQAGLAVIVGIAYGLSQPLTMTLLSHTVPLKALGLAFGWRQIFQRGGELASPLLMGLLVTVSGLESIFWVAGAVLIGMGAAAAQWSPHGGGRVSGH